MLFHKTKWINLMSFIGAFLLVALPGLANINAEDITGMWLFDEGGGTVATDSSQYGNDGTIHGATWVDGKFGKALIL